MKLVINVLPLEDSAMSCLKFSTISKNKINIPDVETCKAGVTL